MRRIGLVALTDLANEPGAPSRATLFALVTTNKIPRYKFPGDRKTYVKRAQVERLIHTPTEKRLRK